MSTGSEPVRVGVVGTGAISQVVHVPILSEREDVELMALADSDPHKAEALSRRFGVPLVLDAEDLLCSDELEAVFLCTPNDLHEEMAIAALEAGKHVFVERPLASTSAGAARVVEAARRSGRLLSIGMPHRFRPEVTALRSFVAGGELGDVYAVRGTWMTRPVAAPGPGWRQSRKTAGGGALVDLGIPWVRLDGSTRNRQQVIDAFQDPHGPPVFLLSLKAGGFGLNLTAADYVVHLDPWWNPAVQQQATDRAHRIGQDKPVVSVRLIAAETVEERIVDLQEAKRNLADAALGTEGGFLRALSADELRSLFEAG